MTLVHERLRDVAEESDSISYIGTRAGERVADIDGEVVAIDIDVEPSADIEYTVVDGRRRPSTAVR